MFVLEIPYGNVVIRAGILRCWFEFWDDRLAFVVLQSLALGLLGG